MLLKRDSRLVSTLITGSRVIIRISKIKGITFGHDSGMFYHQSVDNLIIPTTRDHNNNDIILIRV